MKRSLILTILSALISFQVISQQTISGRVLDESGESLIGAHILSLDDLSIGTSTDENGRFELNISKKIRVCEILVSYIGYNESIVSYDLTNQNYKDILLEQKAQKLSSIEIKATKSIAEEFAVQQITKLDIYKNPNSRADPIRAVNSLASSTNIDESANLSLRGSPPGETGIILNNVPVEDAFRLDQSNGVGQFSIFNTSIINRVDVYPSNPPIEFGASSSGAVVLHTDDFNGTNGQSINLTLAGIGYNLSRRVKKNSSIVTYTNLGFDEGLKSLNKNAFEDIKGFRTIDGGLHWTTQFDESSKLKIFNYTLNESYDYYTKTPSYNGVFKQNKLKNLSIINYEKRWAKNTSIDINQGINLTKASYKFGNLDHNIDQKDLYTSINYNQFNEIWSVKMGSSITANKLDNHGEYATHFFALKPNHPSLSYVIKEWVVNPELYIYNKIKLSNKIKIGFGLRANVLTTSGIKKYTSTQLNLNYNLDNQNNFKLSAGQYNKVFLPGASFENTTIVSSQHFSLDYSYQLNGLTLSSSIYKKRTTYESRFTEITGAEIFAGYNAQKLNVSLALTHLNVNDIIQENIVPNEYDINHFLRLLLKYSITENLEINSVVLLRSGKQYNPILRGVLHEETNSFMPVSNFSNSPLRYSSYNVWDLSVSRTTEMKYGSLITFASCSNLLNLQNQESIRYNSFYGKEGFNYFNTRVIFFGFVYNWQ